MTDDPETARDTGSLSAEANGSATAVTELTPESTGRWLITSRGAQHLIDLDARTYERRPGPTSKSFPYDHQPLGLLRIEVWQSTHPYRHLSLDAGPRSSVSLRLGLPCPRHRVGALHGVSLPPVRIERRPGAGRRGTPRGGLQDGGAARARRVATPR